MDLMAWYAVAVVAIALFLYWWGKRDPQAREGVDIEGGNVNA